MPALQLHYTCTFQKPVVLTTKQTGALAGAVAIEESGNRTHVFDAEEGKLFTVF